MDVLVIDVGGSHVKLSIRKEDSRRFASSEGLTPTALVEQVRDQTHDWSYDVISLGFPGVVGPDGPEGEPGNLGDGWIGFDFEQAFGKPVRLVNDAVLQALGAYDGGRMLFLGLGTGLGSALIAESVIVPLELGQVPYKDGRLSDVLGREGLKRVGKKKWRRVIDRVVPRLMAATLADYVVLGGGNAKKIKTPPGGARLSNNLTAFRGGFRLWHVDDVRTLSGDDNEKPPKAPRPSEWRLI